MAASSSVGRSVVNRRPIYKSDTPAGEDASLLGEIETSDENNEFTLQSFWVDITTKRDFDMCKWIFLLSAKFNTLSLRNCGVVAWIFINMVIFMANHLFFSQVLPHYKRCGAMSDMMCLTVYGTHFFMGWMLTIQVGVI
jgi:hypothetical protein